MPDQAAANGAKFIIHPNRNFEALGPQNRSARDKNYVAENGQKTQSGTRTPIHIDFSTGSNLRCDAPSGERAGYSGWLRAAAIT